MRLSSSGEAAESAARQYIRPRLLGSEVASAACQGHITPQFSGRTLPHDARLARIMKWSARVPPRCRVTVRCNCLLCSTSEDPVK